MTPPASRRLRPTVVVGGRARASFRLCGYAGVAVAVPLALSLVARRGLPLGPMVLVAAAACATFLALALAVKVVTGVETLTYYHHEIAVFAVAAALLAAAGGPIAAYLDATAAGIGAFLAFGRIGCLLAGCCFGRPWRRGVRYGHDHAAEGFPDALVGVPLFPLQAAEAAAAAAITAAVSVAVLRGAAPGVAFCLYVVAYDAVRFALELARGDAERRYALGFSEAQWTAFALSVAVVIAGAAGVVPARWWHAGGAAAIAAGALAVAATRRARRGVHAVTSARHLADLARALDAARRARGVEAVRTEAGVAVSAGPGADGAARYGLSRAPEPLTAPAARALARAIVALSHPGARWDVAEGRGGVFHVAVSPGDARVTESRRAGATF
ncbi:MAG TPA: prolipoprotein diacylglyceryl transferase family protein [Actinomycetota bacterium]|nr:prolipoprotein diacylglyceryl transferase family protein [Actinomycetota bacterium]